VQLLIRDSSRKGVAFISVDGDKNPIGTCFFVDVPWGERDDLTYAVTARHVIEGSSRIYIDALDEHGKPCAISTKNTEWIRSDKTDLACCRIYFEKCRVYTIHLVRFLSPQECFPADQPRLQCGMDVYMVGLFVKSASRTTTTGQHELTPIVRFGKIALEETKAAVYLDPADTDDPEKATSIQAILIESISFEGESGSPVFVYHEHTKDVTPGSTEDEFYKQRPWLARRIRLTDGEVATPLIGMISSHWKIESKVKSKRRKTVGDVGLNSGIAVVVPSDDIMEFLMKDSNVEKERQSVPKRRFNYPASPLSARTPEPEEQAFTRSDFEAALKKVSRKISSD
jgi:hypothetical protein